MSRTEEFGQLSSSPASFQRRSDADSQGDPGGRSGAPLSARSIGRFIALFVGRPKEGKQTEQKEHELAVERRKLLQEAGAKCYELLCTENPLAAGTAWAAYQATVELVENRAGQSAASCAPPPARCRGSGR